MSTQGGGDTADKQYELLVQCCPDKAEAFQSAAGNGEDALECLPGGGYAGVGAEYPLCWQPLVLGSVPGVEELATIVEGPLQVIAAVLRFIAGVLDVISNFLLGFPDPWQALIWAAYNLLKAIIDDFLATGVYLYFDAPGVTSNWVVLSDMGLVKPPPEKWQHGGPRGDRGASPDGFERWAYRFAQSFDDPGDERRPVFSDGADLQAMFVIATAGQLPDLRRLMELLGQLIDIKPFVNAWKKYSPTAFDPDRSRVRGASTAPDWVSWKLRDIAPKKYPMRKLEILPELLKCLLFNVDDLIALLRDLIAAVQAKVQLLLELVEIVQSIIDLIKSLTATGLHYLAVTTNQGVSGLQQAFQDAGNRPNVVVDEDGLEVASTAQAIAGVCFLGGSTGALPIWSLLGSGMDFEKAYGINADGEWEGGLLGQLQDVGDVAVEAAKDTKALAEEAWEDDPESSTFGSKGLKDLGEDLLTGLGLTEEEADEKAQTSQNELVSGIEQYVEEGGVVDVHVLAHIEATRRARRRGRRSLALGLGGKKS